MFSYQICFSPMNDYREYIKRVSMFKMNDCSHCFIVWLQTNTTENNTFTRIRGANEHQLEMLCFSVSRLDYVTNNRIWRNNFLCKKVQNSFNLILCLRIVIFYALFGSVKYCICCTLHSHFLGWSFYFKV